jgi:hypothetical protein
MTARFSVKNSHTEHDLVFIFKNKVIYDTCGQGYYCQTKSYGGGGGNSGGGNGNGNGDGRESYGGGGIDGKRRRGSGGGIGMEGREWREGKKGD